MDVGRGGGGAGDHVGPPSCHANGWAHGVGAAPVHPHPHIHTSTHTHTILHPHTHSPHVVPWHLQGEFNQLKEQLQRQYHDRASLVRERLLGKFCAILVCSNGGEKYSTRN
eukprot:297267-Chlamydomonas_euryale.AAC.1